MPGFLGTEAGFLTDANLVAQIGLYLVICLGVVAQRKELYLWHDRLQTFAVLANAVLISVTMAPAIGVITHIEPSEFRELKVLVPSIHIILGLLAEGTAIYCLLAGRGILPRKIGQLRYWMWAAFTFWTVAVLFGIGTYLVWYTGNTGY
jgi:hypothetical protein